MMECWNASASSEGEVAVEVLGCQGLGKTYRDPLGKRTVTALAEVDLRVAAGQRWAVVGRSGSGKSTLARCLTLHERPDSGSVRLAGEDPWRLPEVERRRRRRWVQWIPQDPAEALDPRQTVHSALLEPLEVHPDNPRRWRWRRADREVRRRQEHRLESVLEDVGLDPGLGRRHVATLSGGQKRRLVLARALLAEPRALVLDESLAGLDLSLRAQVVQRLDAVATRYRIALVWIVHDLRWVPQLADQVLVLASGRGVELTTPYRLLTAPQHPASQTLVEAVLGAVEEGAG